MKLNQYLIQLMLLLLSNPVGLLGQPIRLMPGWETDSIFFMPESAAFDSVRNCIYISNFNDEGGFRKKSDTIRNEFISAIDIQGNLLDLHWTDSLLGPTGIAVYKDKLFAVERGFLTRIDITNRMIEQRLPIPGFGFPNDIAIAADGTIYITDSEKNCIYRFTGGLMEFWLKDSLFAGLNGLFVDGDNLIVGNSNENSMLSVFIPDKIVTVYAKNVMKFVDGIALYKNHYIVTGTTKIAGVDKTGISIELMDSNNENEWYADFELITEKQLMIVPTLFTNRVIAYILE